MNTHTQKLEAAGFTMHPEALTLPIEGEQWGTIAPEPYPVRGGRFTPKVRDVFLAPCPNGAGWYCTSHLHGDYQNNSSQWPPVTVAFGNIFGAGETQEAAVDEFLVNFSAKSYNRAPR